MTQTPISKAIEKLKEKKKTFTNYPTYNTHIKNQNK